MITLPSSGKFLLPSLVLAAFLVATSLCACPVSASDEEFGPTWKLLKPEEKRQFLAGYIYGWQDAARVTDATIEFAENNPQEVISGLKRVRQLYSFGDQEASALTNLVDTFFAKVENRRATLAQAITAAKAQLKGSPK